MHEPTHDLYLTTQRCAVVFDAELQHQLAVLDPAHHIRVRVRTPLPEARARLRSLAGRAPSLVALVRMTPEADASALVRALVHVLRDEPDAWLRLAAVDGSAVDLWPGRLELPASA